MEVINHPESDALFIGEFTEDLAEQGCAPIPAHNLPAGTKISVSTRHSTVLPDMDFETYSEAGYYFDESTNKWHSVTKSGPHGIGAVGASAYTEHESAELLSLAYNLKDGSGEKLWLPGMPPPQDLFNHLAAFGLIEAHNSAFEYYAWTNICVKKLGWPPLDYRQLRDSMAKCRAFSLPGALGKAGEARGVPIQKQKDGQRLLAKFSKPRQPTKRDDRRRVLPSEDPEDAAKLYLYNIDDIRSESALSAAVPDLSPDELDLWLLDQKINLSGVSIDLESLASCKAIVEQAHVKYTAELVEITGGAVTGPGQTQKIRGWVADRGVDMPSLTADVVEDTLKRDDLPADARRVLEIRVVLGLASVKKLFAIDRRVSADGRLRDLFAFCGADRTGRFAGRGPQPQNLPNSGPPVKYCPPKDGGCGRHYGANNTTLCPWCGANEFIHDPSEWRIEAVEDALATIKMKDISIVERYFGDAMATVSGCLRGLFTASPGGDFLCSDYSAIEAVVLAALAREEWRLEVFRTHGKIYEMSAAKITGVPFQEMMAHAGYDDLTIERWWEAPQTGDHHPTRKKIGKVAELASGYGGGVGAWKNFGAEKFFDSDEAIDDAKKAWRAESPAIVAFWYGLENAAKSAVKYPGQSFEYNGLLYAVIDDILYCRLLSGRTLTYHNPLLIMQTNRWGNLSQSLTYMGYNSDREKGPLGWVRLETYGGKLTENVVQATARDILTHAMKNLDRVGYSIALHVHDEIVADVAEGTGSIEELERIMEITPSWAADWPIRAAGGWRGKRYRKD